MAEHLKRLYAHVAWANARALESLRKTSSPPADAVKLYAHIVAAEHVWIARLRGQQPEHTPFAELSLDDAAALGTRNIVALQGMAHAMGDTELARAVPYTNLKGEAFTSEVHDILLHVALHGSYHRGQIAKLVRGAGAEPIPTDYIVYARSK